RVLFHRAPDEVVLLPVILHHRERDDHGAVHTVTIHVAEQIVRARSAAAMPRPADMRVRVEDSEAVLHGRAAMMASVISLVRSAPPISRVRSWRSANTARTAVRIASAPADAPAVAD